MRLRLVAVAGVIAASLAPPAHAQSAAVKKAALEIFQDYVADGRIDPCKHSSQELKLAHDNIPPDIEQYAADYPAAIEAALEARARGECSGGAPKPAVAPVTPAATPSTTPTPIVPASPAVATKTVVPPPPAPPSAAAAATAAPAQDTALVRVAAAQPSSDAPFPVLALGVLLAALACLAAFVVAMNRLGVGEERFAGTVHAWREARWRAGGTWEDFRDWLRLGR